MKKNEILDLLQSLARSQGCWWRLLREVGDNLDEFLDELESMNFKSGLDLILFLEGN